MTLKLTTLIFFTLVVATVMLSSAKTVDAFPYWCMCGESNTKTHWACNNAGANWDGGSCGTDTQDIYVKFIESCFKFPNVKVRCWQ
ncbi:hypothetical protein EC991_008737 [Linnemannia zychae]|nr:hypothetical protein EC991_008737 [Linnemannia zychae]